MSSARPAATESGARASQREAAGAAELSLAQALQPSQRLFVAVQRRVALAEAAVYEATCFPVLQRLRAWVRSCERLALGRRPRLPVVL